MIEDISIDNTIIYVRVMSESSTIPSLQLLKSIYLKPLYQARSVFSYPQSSSKSSKVLTDLWLYLFFVFLPIKLIFEELNRYSEQHFSPEPSI